MKVTSYALAGVLLLSTACQKTDVVPAAAAQNIMGEWHWVSSIGGLSGSQTYTPASTSSTDTWVFRADSTYQHYTTRQGGAQLTETGTFSLGAVRSIYSGQAARALVLRGSRSQTFVVSELSTHLVLADNYHDGFGHTYER